ncbi:MAG: histidine triad protein [Halieaceae bacterium]|nr:histidine triad protein [Halieaceae bacterium]|tara:strand:+ start:202 stop:645 length:444 start_codon:yes stop_codon:yes gene_type:complete
MPERFELDPRLAADTFLVGETPLSHVLLMNDARYLWLILAPRRGDVTEPFELSEVDQAQLWQESMRLGETMKAHFAADKLNIAALGNQVAQLHVHHIARFHTDDAWPGPVWGVGSAVPYSDAARDALLDELRTLLRQPLGLTEATKA